MELGTLLEEMVRQGASDLHLVEGYPPIFRIQGALTPDRAVSLLGPNAVEEMLSPFLSDEQRALLPRQDVRAMLRHEGAAFHCQTFHASGRLAVALRLLPKSIPTLETLGLPPVFESLTRARRGLILVTGPVGSGKSTTVAAMLEHINHTRAERIVTIEDRIEYELSSKLSLITQRQVGQDVDSYEQALASALNSDPDVILLGELRTQDMVRAALSLAESGHLVFSTLNMETVSEAVQRLVEAFPEPHDAIRRLLSRTLQAVTAQQLLPVTNAARAETDQGRVPANEILLITSRVRQMIRDGQTDFTLAMEAGRDQGMQTMDQAILRHYEAGRISRDVARARLVDPSRLEANTEISK